jgi:hypothetical protein
MKKQALNIPTEWTLKRTIHTLFMLQTISKQEIKIEFHFGCSVFCTD